MPPELLALAAAFCYASVQIAVKFATQGSNIVLGLLISLATGVVALGVLAALTVDTWAVPVSVVLLFSLAGLAGPGAGRILGMRAVRDVGTSVATPVQSSTNPLLASVAGVVLFGEHLGLGRALALGLIVGGIWACVRGGSANLNPVDLDPAARAIPVRSLVLLLPLTAGAAHATADIFRKFALTEHGDPVLGALIGMVTALLIWSTIFVVTPHLRRSARLAPSHAWFLVSGLFSATAQICLFFALREGDLSVVAPIVASQPVIVIILGAVLLRSLERLQVGTVIGAAIVFVSVAYLSLS